ncbi:MAG: hypothetical protein ABSG25_01840 [Bryobacteraceae bacterium]
MRGKLTRFLVATVAFASLCCGAQAGGVADSKDAVPSWFRPEPSGTNRLFEAWRSLSTRRAALHLWQNRDVVAGQLLDANGKPVAFAPLTTTLDGPAANYEARWITDKDGYFIIYGAYALEARDAAAPAPASGFAINAAIGYPATDAGWKFAVQKHAVQAAVPKLAAKGDHWAYYVFTMPAGPAPKFDAAEFDAFEPSVTKLPGYDPAVDTSPEACSTKGWAWPIYPVRVLSPEGKPVPNAIFAYYPLQGTRRIVKTDAEGRCDLVGFLPTIRKTFKIDAPGSITGPLRLDLKEKVANDIRLEKPGRIHGRFLDAEGRPVRPQARIEYTWKDWIGFPLQLPVAADGSFSFDRIVPGEGFHIAAADPNTEFTPMLPYQSEDLVLKPGENLEKNITVAWAGAIRGVLEDEQGKIIDSDWTVSLQDAPNHNSQFQKRGYTGRYWELDSAYFSFRSLEPRTPVRIHVVATGFADYDSEPIGVEPGELRFATIKLSRADAAPAGH